MAQRYEGIIFFLIVEEGQIALSPQSIQPPRLSDSPLQLITKYMKV